MTCQIKEDRKEGSVASLETGTCQSGEDCLFIHRMCYLLQSTVSTITDISQLSDFCGSQMKLMVLQSAAVVTDASFLAYFCWLSLSICLPHCIWEAER